MAWSDIAVPDPPAYARVRAICLALPGTTEKASWGHPNFRVSGKAFVTLEAYEGRPTVAIHLGQDQVNELCSNGRFFPTPYGKGKWASLYADGRLNWRLVERLIRRAHELHGPVS